MASPLPQHRRISRPSMNDSSSYGSPNLKAPSTPYETYKKQHPIGRSSSAFLASPNTPQSANTSKSVFLEHQSPNTFAAYRRNVGFGSPGVSAIRSPRLISQGVQHGISNGASGEGEMIKSTSTPISNKAIKSSRFIRRKSFKQKLQEAPSIWYDRIMFSEYLDFSNPAIGYPLGALLHFLSLIVLAMHPEGSLRLNVSGSSKSRSGQNRTSLFSNDQTRLGVNSNLSMRRRQHQDAAWRWSANVLMFFIIIAIISNAYHLFNSRKRYHLWLKPTSEKLQSENAKLVGLPFSEVGAAHQKPKLEIILETFGQIVNKIFQSIVWISKKVLYRLRLVRYIGVIIKFFFPPSSSERIGQRRSSSGNLTQQMHALDVWQAPEVSLRIFTLFSPLHLLVYFVNMQTGNSTKSGKLYTLLISLSLMILLSGQTAILVYFYSTLIKDKELIAGEVMNEYNQKFVMPRAMPICRDASTMTSQSEFLGPDDFISQKPERVSMDTQTQDQYIKSPKSNNSTKRPKKGRATAV